jgi:hypothetical protein
VVENVFDVGGELGIEDGSGTGFLFVELGESDALGDRAALGLGGMKDGYGPRVLLDDDFSASAYMGQQGGNRRFASFGFGKVQDALRHNQIIYRYRIFGMGRVGLS